MIIYNTMTRKKEEFQPIEPGRVKIYACGPTVYNYIHIGNARPIIIFDILRRYFEYKGYQVTFVQNFTDVDDKLIKRATEENSTVAAVAKKYIGEYTKDAAGLNVRQASIHPRATENIAQIVDIVRTLIEKGHAYESHGDVYFRARSFKEYGKLSHQPIDDLEAGARIDISEIKEDPVDFALWKSAKPGEPAWESPWGKGRPGWHIECSAMARRYLGNTIDIHCGGQDLIFPHHENEIAQSECASGHPFAHYWMHNGYLNIDNRKMSKSLNNFFTVREVADRFGYEPIRLLMLSSHYRTPMNYSVEIIGQMRAALERLYNCRESLVFAIEKAETEEKPDDRKMADHLALRHSQFSDAMDDDLNTAGAIGIIFDLAKDINVCISRNSLSQGQLKKALGLFDSLCGVLGILYEKKQGVLDNDIDRLIKRREDARRAKDYKTADEIRDQLKSMGIELKDTAQGVKWSRQI